MNPGEPVKVAVWHALNHYAFQDAVFLAERLYAEVPTEDVLYTLASCYYQSGKIKRTHSLLHKHGVPGTSCRFLMAKCCFDLGRYGEAESYLTGGTPNLSAALKSFDNVVAEFGPLAGYSLQLLGHIYKKSDQKAKAAECFKASLKANPFLWTSFEAICSLGEKVDPLDYFKSPPTSKNSGQTSSLHPPLYSLLNVQTSQPPAQVNEQKNKTQDSFAIENMDPSCQNKVNITPLMTSTVAKQPQIVGNSNTRSGSEHEMPPPAEAPRRHPVSSVGRNLLGAASSNSPLTPSFGMLPESTPTSDAECSGFITPSPLAMTENTALKAPTKKHTTRKIDCRTSRGGGQFTNIAPGPSSLIPITSPSPVLSHSSPQLTGAGGVNGRGLRRSTRLFGSTGQTSTVTTTSTTRGTQKGTQKVAKYQIIEPMKSTVNSRRTKTRRARNSASQPLTPTTENIMSPVNSDSKIRVDSNEVKDEKPSVTVFEAFTDRFLLLLQNVGKAYYAISQYESKKAIGAFENLPPNQYNTCWVLQQVAFAHFEASEYKLAEQVFEEIRRLDPYHVDGMVIYSTLLWLLRREGKLSSLAQDLVDLDKNSCEAWCAMGNCFSLQKEHDDSIKYLQRAIQINPEFTYAYTLMGHEYVHIEELDKGMSCFRSAIRLDDRHYNAWYGIAMIYYKQEKYLLAEKHYLKAIQINAKSSILWCHLAVTQHSLNRTEQALDTVKKATNLNPKNALCKYHKASFLYDLGHYEEALTDLQELEKLVPKESLVYFLLGKIYRKMGQIHLAQMNFSWAMSLNPQGSNSMIKEAMNQSYMSIDDLSKDVDMNEQLQAEMDTDELASDMEHIDEDNSNISLS